MTSQIIGQGLRIKPKPVVECQMLRIKSMNKLHYQSTPSLQVVYIGRTKYPRFLILSWEKEYLQTKRLLNATSHFLISHIVGHLLEFIKISLGPPILKIDNFT